MKKARKETVESAMEWLKKAGVDHLRTDHPERLKATAEWGKWFVRQANPNAFNNMVEKDRNRLGTPWGWRRGV